MEIIKIPLNVKRIERVDDIPLLLRQMEKMEVAPLDRHFPTHGNWQEPRTGRDRVAGLHLSEGDHRLNSVQSWAAGLLMTLTVCLGALGLREPNFSDDHPCIVLERPWPGRCGVGSLRARAECPAAARVRGECASTAPRRKATSPSPRTACSHSGAARNTPDLPHLKINQAVLDPLGLPLAPRSSAASGPTTPSTCWRDARRRSNDCAYATPAPFACKSAW